MKVGHGPLAARCKGSTRSISRTTLQMAMGKRKRDRQPSMWVATTDFPTAASHPFYTRLNQLLRQHGFDDFRRSPVHHVLRRNDGSAQPAAGDLFPAAVDWLLRRDRLRARHRVARGGLVRLARFFGSRSGRRAARLLDNLAHAAVDRFRNASGGLHLGAAVPAHGRFGEGQDDRH